MMKSTDKYSIIIPYRDREDHLKILIPRLHQVFQHYPDYEIIISEQNDTDNFNIACIENIGSQYATGNILVLHQVDYIPGDDVSYVIDDQPVLPARKGWFVDSNMALRDIDDIPGGYRNWHNEIDPNFYGGVVVLRKEHWEKIGGLNPMYRGWGNEDEDLRERLKWAGYTPERNPGGTFICLYHEDNGDMSKKEESEVEDFKRGREIYANAFKYREVGYKNLKADVEIFSTDDPKITWIKSTNFKVEY